MPSLRCRDLPSVGSRLSIFDPSGLERRGLILAYDSHKEEVLVRWYEYPHLPDEWIPARWLA